jgi:hypothetical protein
MPSRTAPVVATLRRIAAREQRERDRANPEANEVLRPRGGFRRRSESAERRWFSALARSRK